MDHGARVRPDGSPREIPLDPPKLAGCTIASPSDIALSIQGSNDTISVSPQFWERFWCLVSFCDEIHAYYASRKVGATQPHGLAWRHLWGKRLVEDSKGYLHPCRCSWWQRWGMLVRRR